MCNERPIRPEQRAPIAPRVLGIIVVAGYFAFLVRSFYVEGWVSELMQKQYMFIVGVPLAVIAAYILVSVLESTRGKIEFEAAGIKFKGASGPIVLWVFVFLALVGAMRLAWV